MEMECKDCPMHCQDGSCGGHRGGKYHMYMLLGTVAIVYGLINYFTTVMGWTGYMAWIVGGALLIIVGLAKKQFAMQGKCTC